MKKILFLFAILLTSVMVTFAPVKPARADVCGVPCLLAQGGQTVQDLGTRIKAILGTIQQTVMGWLEDAKAWLNKYAQLGLSSLGLDGKEQAAPPRKQLNAPNLVSNKTGIAAGKSYSVKVTRTDADGKTVTTDAGTATGTIEKRAEAKQNELMSESGTLSGMQAELDTKNYIAQQESIDALAKALVVKNAYADLKKLGEELDELKASIVPGITPSTAQPGQETKPAVPVKARNIDTAVSDNLEVRLLWDQLLTIQQQVMAMRLKTNTMRAIKEMDSVTKTVEVEEVKPEALPSPQEDPESKIPTGNGKTPAANTGGGTGGSNTTPYSGTPGSASANTPQTPAAGSNATSSTGSTK